MTIFIKLKDKKPLQQLVFLALFACISYIILLLIMILGVLYTQKTNNNFFETINGLRVMQLCAQVSLFFIPALLFAYYFSNDPLRHNLYLKNVETKKWATSIGTFLIAMPFIEWIAYLNYQIKLPASLNSIQVYIENQENAAIEFLKKIIIFNSFTDFILLLFVIAIVPAICEELLFRSVLTPIIQRFFKNIFGVIILSSAIFSIVHFQFLGFLPRFYIGIIFTALFYYNQSVLPGIILHFIFNGLQVLDLYIHNTPEYLEQSLKNQTTFFHPAVGIASGIISIYILYKIVLQIKK